MAEFKAYVGNNEGKNIIGNKSYSISFFDFVRRYGDFKEYYGGGTINTTGQTVTLLTVPEGYTFFLSGFYFSLGLYTPTVWATNCQNFIKLGAWNKPILAKWIYASAGAYYNEHFGQSFNFPLSIPANTVIYYDVAGTVGADLSIHITLYGCLVANEIINQYNSIF